MKSPLARYTPAGFVAPVEKHRIPYHEKKAGRLFCDRSARDIVDMLEEECRRAGVRIFLRAAVRAVSRADAFHVVMDTCRFEAPALVIATGGLSIPKLGATGFGYAIARQFGLRVCECRPALAPLLFGGADRARYGAPAGVSAEVAASAGNARFQEKMLFTHRGLSGPAILQVSSYWKEGASVSLDLAPGGLVFEAARDDASARAALRGVLPDRLADAWIEAHAPARWTKPAVAGLDRALHRWAALPDGTEGYEKAEVTAGGLDTDELSAKTMESRKVRGLFFIGEVADVAGHPGGFNFQWAWASGYGAGQAL
mgnify:CR=1 FL=1